MVSGYEFKKPTQPKLMMLLEALVYVIYFITYLFIKAGFLHEISDY